MNYCWAYSTFYFGGSERQNLAYRRQAHDEEFWVNLKIYKGNKIFQLVLEIHKQKQFVDNRLEGRSGYRILLGPKQKSGRENGVEETDL